MSDRVEILQRTPAQVREQFERDGFVIVSQLITPAEAAALKAEARRVLDEVAAEARARGENSPRFLQTGVYVGMSIRSEVFRRFNRDQRVLDLLEPIIGPNIMFWSDKVVFKSEDTTYGTPWHQDWPYWKGLHKINVWVALDDADETNGCLKLVRGSHRLPVEHQRGPAGEGFGHRVDESIIDPSLVVAAPVPAGGAVIFHDLTLHASFPNTSGRDRWALISTFKDALADDLDYPAMTAAAVVRGRGREPGHVHR
jgi:phytanoyl-CoA hydroxylase